ncbi:hypothetical protein CLV92_10928 [Kineococcus xinjiangensis]|uniref:Uncharacterized protein n=1 Tax=Kineococcus xinjiangensis TaxID=512762 RepID=A0A2S6IHQ6_9ACTN|nr:hypothetical protein [Kineococcus xinjiangensis]PPK93752.1 hypothetical protein CLV92_10928 [Kineococcus xinjiangensis]
MAHPPTEPDDVPGSAFAPGVDEPAEDVAGLDEIAEAEHLLDGEGPDVTPTAGPGPARPGS